MDKRRRGRVLPMVAMAGVVAWAGVVGGCASRELKVEPGQLVQVEKLSLPVREAYTRLVGPGAVAVGPGVRGDDADEPGVGGQ